MRYIILAISIVTKLHRNIHYIIMIMTHLEKSHPKFALDIAKYRPFTINLFVPVS